MSYYPKSQILTNLYTNGDEYVLSTTNQNYVGSYYEISTGQKYSGKSPIDKPNILLNPFQYEDERSIIPTIDPPLVNTINTYPNITSQPVNTFLPQFNSPLPTPDDYKRGIFTRYFCKKNNENKYLEVDQITYNKLTSRDSSILWSLYTPFSLQWKISTNKSLNSSYNQSSVLKLENSGDYRGFSSYIRSYSQYSPNPELPDQQSNPNSPTSEGGY